MKIFYVLLFITKVQCAILDIKDSYLKEFTNVAECLESKHEFFGTVKLYPDNCDSPPKIIGQTLSLGCRCADGYVQMSATNSTCVLASECVCPPNQIWRFFDGKFIVPSCDKKAKWTEFNRINRGCTCKDGYALNDKLKCVLKKHCLDQRI